MQNKILAPRSTADGQALEIDMQGKPSWSSLFRPTKLRRELDLPLLRPQPEASMYEEEHHLLYMVDEWHERQGWCHRLRDTLNHVASDMRTVLQISEAELLKNRMGPSSSAEQISGNEKELPIHDVHDLVIDRDGVILGIFLKGGISIPWSVEKREELVKIATEATSTLAEAHPPPVPNAGDQRHLDQMAERSRMDELGRPHGVWHLGARRHAL